MKNIVTLCGLSLVSLQAFATPQSVRFTDMTRSDVKSFMAGESDVTVEFREGDVLPLETKIEGDFFVSQLAEPTPVKVTKTLFLRHKGGNDFLVSLDGIAFKRFDELMTGSLSASATAPDDGVAIDRLSVNFKLKQK